MTEKTEEELLISLGLKRTWLADIVEVLLHRPNGQAEVDAIVIDVERLGNNTNDAPKETITRRINDFCSDANDADRKVAVDLFQRVSEGTYRLRNYPNPPDLIEIQKVEFDDCAMQRTWSDFCDHPSVKAKLSQISKRQALLAFARNIQPGGRYHSLLEARHASVSIEL